MATDEKRMMEQFIKGRVKVFAKDVITICQGLEDMHHHESTTIKGLNNKNSNNISSIKFHKLILIRPGKNMDVKLNPKLCLSVYFFPN